MCHTKMGNFRRAEGSGDGGVRIPPRGLRPGGVPRRSVHTPAETAVPCWAAESEPVSLRDFTTKPSAISTLAAATPARAAKPQLKPEARACRAESPAAARLSVCDAARVTTVAMPSADPTWIKVLRNPEAMPDSA